MMGQDIPSASLLMIKLGGVANKPEHHAATPRDLNRLDR